MTINMTAASIPRDGSAQRYPVNIRLTVPFLPNPFFITLIVGRERRGTSRRQEERLRHPLNSWGNLVTIITTWSIFSIAAMFTGMVIATL